MRIDSSAAIVTGGATGMGGAAASRLARAGAKVAILARRRELVDDKAKAIGGIGISCDLRDPTSIDNGLREAEATHGAARIVINAAADGRLLPTLLPDGKPSSFEVFRDIVATNLFGTFYLAQQVAARMAHLEPLQDGIRGVIVNVSSIGAADGGMGGIAYNASKGAVDALTLAMARELSVFGIRVMCIAPGPVKTELVAKEIPADVQRMIVENSVVLPKRMGAPEEFARLVEHVVENDFLNGSIVRLDGAMRAPFMSLHR